jgi:hypothetical protein
VLVTVSVRACLLPTVTLPKLRLAGFDPSVPGDIPEPDNALVSEEFEASDVIVNVPLAFPLNWGAKETTRVVLCEGLSVRGRLIPVS